MFIFANCLIMTFLFDETSSNPTEIQHQNNPNFWHDLMQTNGIWDEQIAQIAVEMDKSDSFIEKLSNEENYKKPPFPSPEHPSFEKPNSNKFKQNSTPNELKHTGKQSLFFNLFKLDNFYELVKGQKEMAKMVQDLAKTFITIKSSLIENGQIEITTILDKTENAVNLLAKQNKIVYEKAKKIELPEIVKSMATIWSQMNRIKNGENPEEIVHKIVNLWHSAKQNDEFKKYFGNKSEGKNRRPKRRTRIIYIGHLHYDLIDFIVFGILAVAVIIIFCVFVWRRCLRNAV